jgi:hypothetical protein
LTSYSVAIAEGGGGYVDSGYVSSGYVVATQLATDSLDRTAGMVRTLTPTVTLTDAIKLGISRFITTQAQTISDALTRRIVATRELATGTGGYTTTGYTSSGYLTADQTTMTDSLTRVRDVPRTISEGQVTLTDAIKLGITRFITTQTVTASDTLGRIYGAIRTASETWATTNAVTRVLVATRIIVESTGFIRDLTTAFKGIAGTGSRKIKTATTMIFKRSSITAIFKRNARTSA